LILVCDRWRDAADRRLVGVDLDKVRAGFDECVSAFLATLGGKSPRTYATYQSGLARFREYLEARGQLEARSEQRSSEPPQSLSE
jgi:hypothetical protein